MIARSGKKGAVQTQPDLDRWLTDPAIRVAHRRTSQADPDALWAAADAVRVADAGVLGRAIRWRIPGLPGDVTFGRLFRQAPFMVLDEGDRHLVSGLVGRIWTLRRDYPQLAGPEEFRSWSQRGTARVVFAHWVQAGPEVPTTLSVEARVEALGTQGRIGVSAIRPLVRAFQGLIGSEGLATAVRAAERG